MYELIPRTLLHSGGWLRFHQLSVRIVVQHSSCQECRGVILSELVLCRKTDLLPRSDGGGKRSAIGVLGAPGISMERLLLRSGCIHMDALAIARRDAAETEFRLRFGVEFKKQFASMMTEEMPLGLAALLLSFEDAERAVRLKPKKRHHEVPLF